MPLEIERKFLVLDYPPLVNWPVPMRTINIHQRYLPSKEPGVVRRVRSVHEANGNIRFIYTVKRFIKDGINEEDEREITSPEFNDLWRKTTFQTISKVRVIFDWKGHTFELDVFSAPATMVPMLEVELEDMDEEVELPPFIKIDREVTGEKEYTNWVIAQRPA